MTDTALLDKVKSLGIDKSSEETLSSDLFPLEQPPSAAVIAAPVSVEQVSQLVQLAYKQQSPIITRGGGMSYTGGYRPDAAGSLLLDLRGLNRVRSIDEANRVATVDAGCTWQDLAKALENKGLRSALKGPISGSHSTVGGAASQNLPGSMDGILGIEIVGRDGVATWTGSAGAKNHTGFYRNYGPDLTGMFLGDAGTLGVKTGIALRLEPKPQGAAFASFGFDTMANSASAMAKLARANIDGRIFALDPIKNKTATRVGLRDGAQTLAKVVQQSGIVSGVKRAASIVTAGQGVYDDVPWSMHLTFEGSTQGVADAKLAHAKSICKGMQEIEPSVPVALHAQAFSIRGFLGIKGERWVPMHAIFPLGISESGAAEIAQTLADAEEELAREGVVYSFMMSANGPYFLIEPMFYWPDKRLALHEQTLEARRIAKMQDFQDSPAARAAVRSVRERLRDRAFARGAIACQLGKFYPYRAMLEEPTRALYDSLKATLDPLGLFNPGALQTGTGDAA